MVRDIDILLKLFNVPRKHFENENTPSVPIDTLSIPLTENDLRCKIVRCPAHSVRLLRALHALRKAEISELDMSVLPDEDVLWLEISIDDVNLEPVQASHGRLQRTRDSSTVKIENSSELMQVVLFGGRLDVQIRCDGSFVTRVDGVGGVGRVGAREGVVELGRDCVSRGRVDDNLRDGRLVRVDTAVADEVV